MTPEEYIKAYTRGCSNELAYGDLHTLCDHPHIHTEITSFPSAGKRSFVNPETIGQFTGLKDKNGKEIYEGDILRNNLSEHPFALVGWHTRGYFFCDCNMGSHPDDYKWSDYTPLGEVLNFYIDTKKVEYEVIGNRWDTPGLLER